MSTPAVRIEVQAPTTGFVIGRSRVGDAISLATDTLQWLSLLADTVEATIIRGGESDGVETSLGAGSMTVRLSNKSGSPILADDLTLRPNVPVRALVDVPAAPVVTEWDVANGAVPTNTTPALPFAAPAGKWASIDGCLVHPTPPPPGGTVAAVDSYILTGFYPADGDRVRTAIVVRANGSGVTGRVAFNGALGAWEASSTINAYVSLPAGEWVTMYAEGDPATGTSPAFFQFQGPAGATVEVASWTKTVDAASATAIFTGTLLDVDDVHQQNGPRTVTLTAVDAVAALANTPRYGAVVEGGVGFETWPARIARLMTSATVAYEPPTSTGTKETPLTSPTSAWSNYGSLLWRTADPLVGAGFGDFYGVYRRTRTAGGVANQPASSVGIQRTVNGLTVGTRYRVRVKGRTGWSAEQQEFEQFPDIYAIGVQGIGWGNPQRLEGSYAPVRELSYEFVATATSHVVRITCAEQQPFNYIEAVVFGDVAIAAVSFTDTYRLRDNALQSNLKKHLDVACTSVGGFWWAGKDGPVKFARNLSNETVLALSDTEAPSFVDLADAFDTRRVRNALDVTNLGRDPVTGNTADVASSHTEATSMAEWGPRSSAVDLNLYEGSGYAGSVATRAAEIIATRKDAGRAVTGTAYRAGDALEQTARLDLYSAVATTRNGVPTISRVTGIRHDITPRKWLVTLDLRKE